MHNQMITNILLSECVSECNKPKKDLQFLESLSIIGGEERIRTVDLLTASDNVTILNNLKPNVLNT